jgi:predicted dehydrogenase
MTSIRVGILGFGFISNLHARAVSNTPGLELAGVWTREDGTADSFRNAFPGGKLYPTMEALTSAEDIDAVVIGLPNSLHFPQTMAALTAGKHVLVEKPMALNVVEAEAMADYASRQGLRLMVGHMWRFDREFLAVKALVDAGRIGTIVKTKGYGIHENWGPEGWFVDPHLAGGGALIDMGVHALDSVRFLIGDPRPVRVFATIGTHYGDYQVDDSGVLMVVWDNGITSVIESGWWHPHMDGPEASTQLFGTKGYARVFPTMAKFTDGAKPWLPRFEVREDHCDQHIYDGQMAAFGAAIAAGVDPVPGADEGMTVLRICAAAYESARTGKAVQLAD